ncbi:hypothetical protein HN51_005999 [Arachis hypogaea]|nr:sucrose transport protein SUC7-like [Arachis hypogaea]QHO39849.1 Sucrose transport protein [Arachis hypogaea]
MAVRSVLGYLATFLQNFPTMFPFTITKASDSICANLTGGLFFSMPFLVSLMGVALSYLKIKQVLPEKSSEQKEEDDRWTVVTCFREMLGAIKGLQKPMSLMTVTSINWLAWSMIFMYIYDWMGREVYNGKPRIKVDTVYDTGYRYVNCGLILNWFAMGAMSLVVEPIGRALRGTKFLGG